MIVVSDTSPICYLLLINQIEILQILYNVVTIPQTVADELSASESPHNDCWQKISLILQSPL